MDKRQTTDEMIATLLDELETEKAAIAKLRADLAAREAREAAILQVIDGMQRLFPTSLPSAASALPATHPERQRDAPRGREAVMAILKDLDRWMTSSELVKEMTSRGWRPDSDDPEGAVRTTLGRAMRDKVVTRQRRDGRTYEYRALFDPYDLEGARESTLLDDLAREAAASDSADARSYEHGE